MKQKPLAKGSPSEGDRTMTRCKHCNCVLMDLNGVWVKDEILAPGSRQCPDYRYGHQPAAPPVASPITQKEEK